MGRRPHRLPIALLALLVPISTGAQPVGGPPPLDLGFQDVAAAFALPPLKDASDTPLGRASAELQVISRARRLGLDGHAASEAWRRAGTQLDQARAAVDTARQVHGGDAVAFEGERASELNRALADTRSLRMRVAKARLVVDEPLRIGRDGVRLDLGQTELVPVAGSSIPYLIRIERVRGVSLVGGAFSGPGAGVLVSHGAGVVVADGRFEGLSGEGIVITDSQGTVVWGNRLSALGRAGVLLHGATRESVVADNDIHDNRGASNWQAGVVVTDRNADLAATPLNLFEQDGYWAQAQPITSRLSTPRRNLVAFNRIARNRASGIYFDGAAEDVVAGNLIQGNAKEGMCLDNGSTANAVALNTIEENGKRWGGSDEDLKRDFVAGFGRLADGSAAAKVPGLSLDNAAYNLVYGNEVLGNYGGGIKMVRTGYFNVVGLNTLVDNNRGRSDRFHFFGIELGAAEADAPAVDLDFAPSRGNIVFANAIRGSHYAGVFFAEGSDRNDLFDNSIFGATNWAIESVVRQDNAILNNLTNLPSRNAGSGLDRRLAAPTAGRHD